MSEQQEHVIKDLSQEESTELTETLYKRLVDSLAEAFNLKNNEARKVVITTLRGLYEQ